MGSPNAQISAHRSANNATKETRIRNQDGTSTCIYLSGESTSGEDPPTTATQHSPCTCSLISQEMDKITAVLHDLDKKGHPVKPVFITIDPFRDTRERLASYFKESEYHPGFLALTGTFEQVRERWTWLHPPSSSPQTEIIITP